MFDHADTQSLDKALAYRIYRVQRLLRLNLVRFLEAYDLTPEYYFILFRLVAEDGVRQQTLVDPVIGDRPNISRHVAGLVKRGLVERRPDPKDKRAHRIFLTDAGRALIDGLRDRIVEERHRIFDPIAPEQLDVFTDVLHQLEAHLSS